ncbi:cathepsin b [Stylonychia lemnae]|uniref:Cathepsin b n=1 Tax=Stylonychia lemnae TaxID=5949 RepID=A0A077ZRH9_STYLE|nr:cathepsin b [Stylonychia lemnae]|eukprot:CDW72069.1 cathepsin b [Stylonychia lemnae]
MNPEKNPLKSFSVEQIKSLLGVKLPKDYDPTQQTQLDTQPSKSPFQLQAAGAIKGRNSGSNSIMNRLPYDLDNRKRYPDCVNPIRDQMKCGSCWAFSSTNMLAERICVATKGAKKPILSPQNLVSCYNPTDWGCDGGYVDETFKHLEDAGVNTDDCMPYQSGNGTNVQCPAQCANSDLITNTFKCKSGSTQNVSLRCHSNNSLQQLRSEEQLKNYLYYKGSLVAQFDVYSDFLNYGSGVYYHLTGDFVGRHAVKMIGYGVEAGIKYYLCANQWGTEWGDKGYFKIRVGDVKIDQDAYGCDPVV